MSHMTERELRDAAARFAAERCQLARDRMARRRVLTGATILAAGGIIAACGGSTKEDGAAKGGGSGTNGPTTTGGAPGTALQVPDELKRFPYVDKYNWRRLD